MHITTLCVLRAGAIILSVGLYARLLSLRHKFLGEVQVQCILTKYIRLRKTLSTLLLPCRLAVLTHH